MKTQTPQNKFGLPESFKPLLWWLRWDTLDVWNDRRHFIMAAINEVEIMYLK